MQVSKEGIEAIKGANPIAEVVAERGIELKRKGRTLVARCPFHSPDKTPSFTLTPSKGLYHCFGCGAAGDVIGFVTKHDRTSFGGALAVLARRAGLSLEKLMQPRPRILQRTPLEALTPPRELAAAKAESPNGNGSSVAGMATPPAEVLARVVEHYHRTLLAHEDAQAYLKRRGLTDVDLWRTFQLGYADGSLLKAVPKEGELRQWLIALGVVTKEGRELLGGCVVVPLPDPVSGAWVSLYGRGMRAERHCYLPGPLRGLLNYQAAASASEVVLTESVIDALSLVQAGILSAIPLYGTNGFTSDHLDTLLKSPCRRVVLCLDNDEAGRKAAEALREKLGTAGIAVRVASLPAGVKDPNQLLVSHDGDACEVLRQVLAEAAAPVEAVSSAASPAGGEREKASEGLRVRFPERVYQAKALNLSAADRLRVVLRVEGSGRFLVDTLDLYAARSRREYARRAGAALKLEPSAIEEELLGLVSHLEAYREQAQKKDASEPVVEPMGEREREEALGLLRRSDLLDQVARDIEALGYVGEDTNKRLLYLVAVSRKLDDPLSAIVMSGSGAGKSGLTEVIEKLTPPEDVVLLTRLTPQSLYYTEPGFLDRKLVIVEERYGSQEADYSIRVLQSRKKLIAAAPIKDPQTGSLRTKVFTVEARAAFIEATTAAAVNHQNATRCFELAMDESEQQTRRIHERQRLLRTERGLELRGQVEAIVRRHWNAQRLLEPAPAVIPFADKLSFPSSWMRTRRDHARFLNLIEVSAFLHQHQRARRAGAVVAEPMDYAVAYELASEVLADTLQDLRKPLREAYERIRALCGSGEGVTRREIREALAQPDSTVRRWLADLVELDYLEMEASKGGQGRSARYRLAGRGPRRELVLGLLRPEQLEAQLGRPSSNTRHFATNPPSPVAGSIS